MRLQSDLKVNLQLNESLAPHTSFKIGGIAHFYAEPQNLTELLYLLKFRKSEDIPVYILGAGSNTLFSDAGFRGLVINMKNFEKDYISIDGLEVRVSSGVLLHHFAVSLKNAGLGGMEFLSQIPGTIGGGLVMNAGFGKDAAGNRKEIGNYVREVCVLTPEGDFKRFRKEEICFGYRTSSLGGYLILEAVFELTPKDPKAIQVEMDKNADYRRKVQDWTHPSAGSVFKNPAGDLTVGEMVERLGLKGVQIGDAQISKIHGNFIVNVGQATAKDILALIQLIREKVSENYKVQLETELKVVGE